MKIFATFGRAAWLALFLCLGGVSAIFAHALPGSVLTFSKDDNRLALSIALPLEDLTIAAPELTALTKAPRDAPVSDEDLIDLARYFAGHLSVRQASTELKLSLVRASTQAAYDEHLGEYDLIVLHFDIELSDATRLFPMTLTYDAVMHEIRNHRARVYWAGDGAKVLGLVEFGFRPIDGTQPPVVLRLP